MGSRRRVLRVGAGGLTKMLSNLLMLSNPYPGEKHGEASGFIGIKNRTHRTKNEKEGEKEEHPACEKVSEVERHQGITMVIEFKSTSF